MKMGMRVKTEDTRHILHASPNDHTYYNQRRYQSKFPAVNWRRLYIPYSLPAVRRLSDDMSSILFSFIIYDFSWINIH